MSNNRHQQTIAAQATPPGRGGVAIIRVSGPNALTICQQITNKKPTPRIAEYCHFYDQSGQVVDLGLVLYFPNPHSFTGEEVVEFHGHGGPVVADLLLQRILQLGAVIANPGEFSERAFLNGKIDLAQAEAIADLIDSCSKQAARCAVRSLQGDFSKQVTKVVEMVTKLRMFIEAAIDFPEEEVDFLEDDRINSELKRIFTALDELLATAKQGALLREGIHVVIAGKPNAGKSSLLNCLSGREAAIVTEIPGTTRDLLKEQILLEGIPLHIIDTAGLRESDDIVEQEGVRRAWDQIKQSDRILLVVDSSETEEWDPYLLWPQFRKIDLKEKQITVIRNKSDKTGEQPGIRYQGELCLITLSAKQQQGINFLREHLRQVVGAETTTEGGFIARQRHLEALRQARYYLQQAQDQFNHRLAGELLAEDLRQCQQVLGTITGEFTADDLLGEIFSTFCIGK